MDVSYGPQRALHLEKPFIVGYMSVDAKREYHNNLSQLKFLNSIPKKKIKYNLNYNSENSVKRTTDDLDEKITLMLKFLLDQRKSMKFLNYNSDLTFISYRRTLISVMVSPYHHEPISIVASLFKNCIYLCTLEPRLKTNKKVVWQDQYAKFCAWGYKFEQYMLSDSPNRKPDIEKPIVENEEFTLYFTSQLGKHKLFYGAQTDGMLATCHVSSPPDSKDLNPNLMYLRNNEFIELKTNKEIHSHREEQTFKRYKMLRCWCQCYLAGLRGLLVGYRDEEGIIERVQWFDTDDIVKYCWNEWEPQPTIDFLDYFLSYVENCFKCLKANTEDDFANKEPLTQKFDMDGFQKITVSKDVYQDNEILPDWYVKEFQDKA